MIEGRINDALSRCNGLQSEWRGSQKGFESREMQGSPGHSYAGRSQCLGNDVERNVGRQR